MSNADAVQTIHPYLFIIGKVLTLEWEESIIPVLCHIFQTVYIVKNFSRFKFGNLNSFYFTRFIFNVSIRIIVCITNNLQGVIGNSHRFFFKNILGRKLVQKEMDIVITFSSGVSEIHNPMCPQKIVVRERGLLISAKLEVHFLPGIINLFTQILFIHLIELTFRIKSCQVN